MNAPLSMQQFVSGMSVNAEMQSLMRDMLFASCRDVLDATFENDYVKAAFLAFNEGADQAPSGSPFFFGIGRIMSPWGFVKGGLSEVAKSFARAAEAKGATIRTNSTVVKILIKNNKAYGVRLADGTEITANVVIANTEPLTTFTQMVDPEWSPKEYTKALSETNHENGGGSTLNLALSKLPDFGFPEDRYNGFFGITPPGYDYYEKCLLRLSEAGYPRKTVFNDLHPILF